MVLCVILWGEKQRILDLCGDTAALVSGFLKKEKPTNISKAQSKQEQTEPMKKGQEAVLDALEREDFLRHTNLTGMESEGVRRECLEEVWEEEVFERSWYVRGRGIWEIERRR